MLAIKNPHAIVTIQRAFRVFPNLGYYLFTLKQKVKITKSEKLYVNNSFYEKRPINAQLPCTKFVQ